MKLFICCSKHMYHLIEPIKKDLEKMGHEITLPNSYADPFKEDKMKLIGEKEHSEWKGSMIKLQEDKIKNNEGILVLNFEKKGLSNYIGGATFLEIYKAWEKNKKVFLFNPIPENIFSDELKGMCPKVINGDFSLIK